VIHVAVISTDSRLEELLRGTGVKTSRIDRESLHATSSSTAAPAALIVDVRGQSQLPAALPAFRKQHANTSVILVASTLEPRLMLDAMRAGVNECVQEPVTADALEQAIRRVTLGNLPQQSGQVFAFVGAKGGVGGTTLAVNTAVTLSRLAKSEVLVVDFHVGHGDASLFLGVEPRFSVVDAVENVHRMDEAFFRSIVEKTKAGIDLLAASDRVGHGPLDPNRVRALIDFASSRYRYVLLDLPRSDMSTLDVLEVVSTVVVITTQELASLRSAGRLAHMLRTRYGSSRVMAVMNRFDRRAEIAHADVERVIGDSVKHVIPSDYRTAIEALNVGRPIALEPGPLSNAFRSLAGDLGGIVKQQRERPAGVLGRLAFRRA
jgi:pilus assembly protein CpaE